MMDKFCFPFSGYRIYHVCIPRSKGFFFLLVHGFGVGNKSL